LLFLDCDHLIFANRSDIEATSWKNSINTCLDYNRKTFFQDDRTYWRNRFYWGSDYMNLMIAYRWLINENVSYVYQFPSLKWNYQIQSFSFRNEANHYIMKVLFRMMKILLMRRVVVSFKVDMIIGDVDHLNKISDSDKV
jgi:hypothetical protein